MLSFYSLDDVEADFGSATELNGSVPANPISLAAKIFFLNGGVKFNVLQMDGSSYSAYTADLTKLELEDIDAIISLHTNASTFSTIFSDTKAHVYNMSQPEEGKNRMALVVPDSTATKADYIAYAEALASERMVITAPSTVIIDMDGVETECESFYLNAALAGFMANPSNKVSDPLTRKQLTGFLDVGTRYKKSELRELISSGVLVVENVGTLTAPIIRVSRGVTTDMSLLDTGEISLVRISDFFGKTLASVLDKMFVGTGSDASTPSAIAGVINMVVENFINSKTIVAARSISVTQDTLDPTLFHVALQIQPVYPLNFIDIRFQFSL
jgi:hypothetical protein